MPSRSQNLQQINHRLLFWLDSVAAQFGQPAVATPEQMAALLSELLSAGANLRERPIPPKGDDPELDLAIDNYRCSVERLREVLPLIHGQLLAERARIEARRARINSAAAWATASRQTL
jgi:hypothetical protein